MHSFDPKIAAQVGVNAAVIYQNLVFWTEKNFANGKHVRDGYVWTYNSHIAFESLFPYLTGSQIRTAIQKLLDECLVIKDNFNASTYDRTTWYSPKISQEWVTPSICEKSQMDLAKTSNGFAGNHQPIPDSKPDHKPDVLIDAVSVFDAYNDVAQKAGWPIVSAKTKKREGAAKARIAECGGFDNWLEAMHRAAASMFLSGKATGTTPASFDWLNNPTNFARLMEGNYDNRNRQTGHSQPAAHRPGANLFEAAANVAARRSGRM